MQNKRLWIIFLIIFVNLLGFGIILPLMPYYIESMGAGPLVLGLLSASYSLFQLLSAPILGELSDKFGRRPVLLFSIGGTALSFFLMGASKTLPMLFIARIIDGASGGNISTAQAYIADITSKENRTQGMGFMMAAFSLGFILGPALGGLLSVYGYQVPAYVAGAFALLATILTYFFLPESRKPSSTSFSLSKKHLFKPKDFIDALLHPQIGLLLTISFLMMFAFSLMQGTFSLFTQNNLSFNAQSNGLVLAYLGLVGVIVQMFFLKTITARFKESHTIGLSIALMAVSLALIGVSRNLPSLLFAVTLLALGNSVAGPLLTGLISKRSPESEQGNIAGLSQSVGSIARLIGPLSGTFIYGSVSPRAPFYLSSLVLAGTVFYSYRGLLPKKASSR